MFHHSAVAGLAGAGVIEMNRGYVHRSVFIGECPRRARLRLSATMSASTSRNAAWMNQRRRRAEGDGANASRSGGRGHEHGYDRAEGASVSTERRANWWERPMRVDGTTLGAVHKRTRYARPD